MTFYDVFALPLASPLVVLSGCNTGTVSVGAGDELQGLMRGFFHAGAPSLVVSMWAADDASTASLMGDFYDALREGASARDALAAAQRAALARDPHPYYWASFVLYGRVT
jgi:CHAT domain-containing protein